MINQIQEDTGADVTIEDDGTWKRIWDATIGTTLGGTAPQPPAIGSVPGSSAAGDATPQSS